MFSAIKKLLTDTHSANLAPADQTPHAVVRKSEVLERLNSLTTERGRVRSLIGTENERANTQSEQLREKETERIDALAAALLSGTDSDPQRTEALQAEAEALRRGIAEASAVAARMDVRLKELDAEFKGLTLEYQNALAAFLDDLYAEAMGRYNALAPHLADAVIQVAAVRRAMMNHRLGNTNGWNGHIYLPGMEPKQGKDIPPILDGGSEAYSVRADRLAGEVAATLRAAGFVFNLK